MSDVSLETLESNINQLATRLQALETKQAQEVEMLNTMIRALSDRVAGVA